MFAGCIDVYRSLLLNFIHKISFIINIIRVIERISCKHIGFCTLVLHYTKFISAQSCRPKELSSLCNRKQPPLGLSKINVSFGDTEAVQAATCINCVKLPIFNEDDFESFKLIMDTIIDTDTFTSL